MTGTSRHVAGTRGPRALPDNHYQLVELEAIHLDIDRGYLVGEDVAAALRRFAIGWEPPGIGTFLAVLVALEAEDLALDA